MTRPGGRRAYAATVVLALLGCRRAAADPPHRPASPTTWRVLAPGVRFAEFADTFTEVDGRARAARWVVARLDLARTRLSILRSPNDRPDGVAPLGDVVLAVNAGFFNPDFAPTGLVVSEHSHLAPPTFAGGSGALVIAAGRARLVSREALDGGTAWAGASLALQCNPRLIEVDGTVGVYRDDGRRFARTAACIRDRGRTLDLIATWQVDDPLRGPSLFEFAHRLGGPGPSGEGSCEAALNLDGGPSTGLFARAGTWRYHREPVGPTPWLLVARP